MAITFPTGDDKFDGALFYVPNSDLVLRYDEPTNSWNIVGPDNLATIDYVNQTIATDATKTYRNSALHRETNSIGVDTTKFLTMSAGCTNAATGSFAGDHKYDPVTGNPLGPGNYNSPEYLIESKGTLPEWHECVGNAMPAGSFTYIGHDLVTSNGSSEFRYVLGFSITKNNADFSDSQIGPIVVGDVLELYQDATTRTSSEVKFALYEVKEIYESLQHITFSVIFLDSDTPQENIQPGGTYQFISYTKTLEKTGGELSGDLKIVNNSPTTLEVYKNEDPVTSNNPYNLVFKVNTNENDITVNYEYNKALYVPQNEFRIDLNQYSVATVGYVNDRLGLARDERFNNEDGPYLRTAGGTIDYVEILNGGQGGFQNFVIRGITSNSNSKPDGVVLSTLNNASNSNLTEINYFGPQKKATEIVTKKYVDDLVENSVPEWITDLNNQSDPYLKKDGSVRIEGQLKTKDKDYRNGYRDNILDYDDQDIPVAAAIKGIVVATVLNGTSYDKGVLFEENGVLYYNTYA